MTDSDRSRWPGRSSVYGLGSDASAILGVHRPDERGMCAGCQTLWSFLVPFPCRQAEWASAVSARVATLAVLGPPAWLPASDVDAPPYGFGRAGAVTFSCP